MITAMDVVESHDLNALGQSNLKTNGLKAAIHSREPALDGIRALAILLVLFAHIDQVSTVFLTVPGIHQLRNGGFVGVNVFFVLSGFLITSLLLEEYTKNKRIDLGRFFLRRSVRLIPALFVFVIITSALAAATGYLQPFTDNNSVAASTWHALTFTSNFQHLAPNQQDGGLFMGDLSPLWSLAIEWQFYLVWPFILMAILRLGRSLKGATWIIGALVVLAAINRAYVFQHSGWVAAYHRTDAAMDGLLIGSLTAILFARGFLRGKSIRKFGWLGIAIVVISAFTLRGDGASAHFGGIFLAEVGAALMISAAFDHQWLPRRGLSWKPAVAIGVASYGIYLWHFAAFNWVQTLAPSIPPVVALSIGLIATAALVVASRRFVETPSGRVVTRYLKAHPRPQDTPYLESRRRFTSWTAGAAVISSISYIGILWNMSLNTMRSDVRTGYFGSFYDLQARSMFHGRFNVPLKSLGLEGFRLSGKEYTYFPPFPSIIRMPVLLVSNTFDGRLTSISMLAAWIVAICFGIMLMWRVRVMTQPSVEVTRAEAFIWSLLVLGAFAGSCWLYLGSLPSVYHEAFVWGCAGSFGALYFLTSTIQRATVRRSIGLGVFLLIAVWSRTTMGWGCAIAAIVAAVVLLAQRHISRRQSAGILAAAFASILAGAAVTYIKFQSPFMHPLAKQVWTQINAQRRAALAANGGGLTGLKYLPSTIATYFNPTGLSVHRYYPFIFQPLKPPPIKGIGGALFDQTYRTASVVASMPLLFLLTCIGVIAVIIPLRSNKFRNLAIPVFGAAIGAVGVLAYGYISERYLGDFLPILLIGSTVGTASILSWSNKRKGPVRGLTFTAIALLAVWGILANSAIAIGTLHTNINRGDLTSLIASQRQTASFMGGKRPIHHYTALPDTSQPNDIAVIDPCRAIYFGTGERFEPWIPAALTEMRLRLTPREQLLTDQPIVIKHREGTTTTPAITKAFGPYDLATIDEANQLFLQVETNTHGQMRLLIVAKQISALTTKGPWLPLIKHDLVINADIENQLILFEVDGSILGAVPTGTYDNSAFRQQAFIQGVDHDVEAPFSVTERLIKPNSICLQST